MAKNLIIGAFSGYDYDQLKPWVESIGRCGFDGDKVLIVGQASQETIDKLLEQNVKVVPMKPSNSPIHVARFLSIYDFLKDHWHEYEYVVTTDVKDVYFQTNPINWMKNNIASHSFLVAGSESMLYKDEPWGNDNLLHAYGPYVHELYKDKEIYNVGTIGGSSDYVKDLMFNIFTNATNRPIAICDQAVYNVLLQTVPYSDITFFAKQIDGWACQAGTTVDPSKIESFRPFLTEKEPIFEDGVVKTCDGVPFAIVHQYDRVPAWKKFVRESFGQEDNSNMFVYRTT
jgi:hypothetical protein